MNSTGLSIDTTDSLVDGFSNCRTCGAQPGDPGVASSPRAVGAATPGGCGRSCREIEPALVLFAARRLGSDSQRHPSHGTKRRWQFGATRTRGTEVDAMNRSGRFPASHYDRHGLRIRRPLPLPLRERGHGPRERMRSAPRGRRVRTMPTAKSKKREAARGISEVERRSRSERSWRDPSGQRSEAAVRAVSGVATAARRDMSPSRRHDAPDFLNCDRSSAITAVDLRASPRSARRDARSCS